jgi:NAD(P)-dependent dehydrogenase (short-subunit alcohol dehydrogenase family)
MSDLAGKTVIVTGATGSLGRATSLAFARAGASLALVARDPSALARLRDSLPPGAPALVYPADLLQSDQTRAMAEAVKARFGGIHVLANIAGGFQMGPAVHETSDADWEQMLDLNLRTALNSARAVIPSLLEQGAGRLIQVAARAATRGVARMAPYCVAKSAIVTLTESLSEELKHRGITVNCVLPGTLDTPANRADMPDQDPANWVPPEALAEVILFLASDAARCVTGAAIPVYGRS